MITLYRAAVLIVIVSIWFDVEREAVMVTLLLVIALVLTDILDTLKHPKGD